MMIKIGFQMVFVLKIFSTTSHTVAIRCSEKSAGPGIFEDLRGGHD